MISSFKTARLVLGIFLAGCFFIAGRVVAVDYSGEKIVYGVSPTGTAEYKDLGTTDLAGVKVNLITFRTRAIGFSDLEKIYADPVTSLPIKIERFVAFPIGKEYLVEEYDPKRSSLTVKKFAGNKIVKEYHFKADSPIHNAILLPFSLRRMPDLKVGLSFTVRFPAAYKVTLTSIDDIEVPAGKFKAYHFTSEPHKFEVWITQDQDRIPVKIKGAGGLNYTLSMKSRSLNKSR